MPFVLIRITEEGAPREQKAELVRRTTQALVEVLGKRPETTHVVIEEVPLQNWGIAGELVDERRARERGST
jgi:4-oxalocrotonate tautomerase